MTTALNILSRIMSQKMQQTERITVHQVLALVSIKTFYVKDVV